MRKLLYTFETPWQAEIFQGLLGQEGVESFALKGAREYMTILTGMGQPPTEVFVDEAEFEKAQKILSDFLRKSQLRLVDPPAPEAPVKPKDHFKYVVFMSAIGAVVVPVIFNVLATYHLKLLFTEQNVPVSKKMIAAIVLVVGWVATLFVAYQYRHFFR